MKVIKNNYNKPREDEDTVLHICCDHCMSELEVTKEDTYIGRYGARFITCPCCGKETMIDDIGGIILTTDNLEFPLHFAKTETGEGIKEISPKEIVEEIKKGVNYLETHDDEWAWYTAFGDVFITIYKHEEDSEYYVIVSKSYYETYLPILSPWINSQFADKKGM